MRVDWIWLYLKPSGRLTRWPYFLANALLSVLTGFVLYRYLIANTPLEVLQRAESMESLMGTLYTTTPGLATVTQTVLVLTLWPMIALAAKRVQDIGLSPFLGAVVAIPGVSMLAFLVLALVPGKDGRNAYGAERNAPPAKTE